MNNNFMLKLTEDMVVDVQALGAEVDVRTHVINAMFEAHKNDTDASILFSVPFKAYQKELIEYKMQYDKAVKDLGDKIIPMVQEKLNSDNLTFDWNISDFSKLEAEIIFR